MNNLVINIRKISDATAYPFIFLSSFVLLINLLALLPIEELQTVKAYFVNGISVLFCVCVSAFIVFCYCENTKKAIISSLAVVMSDLIFYSISGVHYSFMFVIIISFVCAALFKNLDLLYGWFILLFCSAVFALILGIVYPFAYEMLKSFCSLVKEKPALFGVINNVYSIFFSDNFGDMFYHKSYSMAAVINENLVSGAKDIFALQKQNPSSVVSKYLTGKYFVSVFVTTGLFFALYSKFDEEKKTAFTVISMMTFLAGDLKLMSVFLLLFNPFIYLCFLALIFVCYFVSRLLDIRIGFLDEGSLFELISYGNKWIYFVFTGIVIAFLTYFAIRLVLSKFDFDNRRFFPKEVKRLVAALGGEKNIEHIKNDLLYVKNPNLIDIIKVDCDIHENVVTLCYDDLQMLKEYF